MFVSATRICKCVPRVNQLRRLSMIDITGSTIKALNASAQNIDDTIMRIISLNDKKYDYNCLSSAIATDKNCGMLYILMVYDNLRSVRNNNKFTERLIYSFNALSYLQLSKLLSLRELYITCALYQYHKGNYYQAALLLETNNSLHPYDTLSMKLAQECHIACGNHIGSLSCITRYMSLINQNHPIRRNLLGLLSHGFVESNYVVEAEETSMRSIEMTSEHDLNCISANLNLFIVQCKAAETSAAVDVS